ncbi:GntR family transcriptional regulator [Micromonospora sp. NPDC050397]|uniref:GntR family transcriptional regulator n=1 Tax=Micromonospora sp. NPDC050397 TaxID=3364279 RepID=UPI003850C23A
MAERRQPASADRGSSRSDAGPGRLYRVRGIIAELRELILSGALRAGDRLPTETRLRDQHGMAARLTWRSPVIRKALTKA